MDKRRMMWVGLGACVLITSVWLWSARGSDSDRPEAPRRNGSTGSAVRGGAAGDGRVNIHPDEKWVLDYASGLRAQETPVRAEQITPLARRVREHDSPAVRALAVTSMGSIVTDEPSAKQAWMQAVLGAMEDPSLVVRQRAVAALRKGRGLSLPYFQADAPEPRRKRALQRFRQWLSQPAGGD